MFRANSEDGHRRVEGGHRRVLQGMSQKREADIVSSMSIGPVGVRVGKRPRRVGSLFGCRANANRRLKLNNTAAKLRRNHPLLKVNLVGAGKLEVVDAHVGRNTHRRNGNSLPFTSVVFLSQNTGDSLCESLHSLWLARLSLPFPRRRFHKVSWLGREASK